MSKVLTLYQIEKLHHKTREPTDAVYDCRNQRWVCSSQPEAGFPTPKAATIYAIENGFEIGKDVLITEHQWVG